MISDSSSSQQQQPSGILQQTLGELLQNNTHAQGMIMQSMRITPEQFQQMLSSANNNQLMQMPIADLFKNGIVQQAVSQQSGNTAQAVQLSPEQTQQIISALPLQQGQPTTTQQTVEQSSVDPKESFWQKMRKSIGL